MHGFMLKFAYSKHSTIGRWFNEFFLCSVKINFKTLLFLKKLKLLLYEKLEAFSYFWKKLNSTHSLNFSANLTETFSTTILWMIAHKTVLLDFCFIFQKSEIFKILVTYRKLVSCMHRYELKKNRNILNFSVLLEVGIMYTSLCQTITLFRSKNSK